MISIVAALVLGVLLAGAATAGPLDTPGEAKALTCSACHGAAGNSRSDTMPILAGMSPAYFMKAIDDYAAGRRPSPEMEPFAKSVKILGAQEIAAWFAAQPRQQSGVKLDRAAVERGRAASTQCVACHGENGRGDVAKVVPSLAGQPPGYLRNQMLLFKADKRSPGDEPLVKMKTLMKSFSDATLEDLAAYYSSLR
jgi:cytochrome c553